MALLYILPSKSNGRFYIGSTTDMDRRLREHIRGHTPSTRSRGPWKLIYQQEFPTLSLARRKERRLKAWKSHTAIAQFLALETAKG
ncbi:MAG: GIY-YIG nuclease family protein [Terriglobia bacterium]